MLQTTLGLNFVAKELQDNLKESIFDSLGLSSLTIEQLVEIAQAFLRYEGSF